jgi:release factor glutamine methyltransferase
MVLLQPTPIKPSTEPWTIRQALVRSTAYLQAEGLPDPRLSVELLMGSVLGLDRLGLLLSFDQILRESERRSFEEKVLRRARHEPIAYLTGQKEFWSLNFEINSNVLIPRPETELLVEEALKILSDRPENKTVVELGTGSGAVAVASAKSISDPTTLNLLATDLSWPALQTAKRNAVRHGVAKIISFVQGDWLTPFSSQRRWIDLLISNPPYVSDAEILHLPMTVKGYEPCEALSGGPGGLKALQAIIEQAGRHLKKGGWLVLEIGETQARQVLRLAQDHFFHSLSIRRDYAGKDRVLIGRWHG